MEARLGGAPAELPPTMALTQDGEKIASPKQFRLGLYSPLDLDEPPRFLDRMFSVEDKAVMQLAIARYNHRVSNRSDLEPCVLAVFEVEC